MFGPLPIPGSLDMKNVQVAPLAGTWQTLHGPVSGTFRYLEAAEELTLVKLPLNTRHLKFEISVSPLIVLTRYKINLPKVTQLRRGSSQVKALAFPVTCPPGFYYWGSWSTAPCPGIQRFLEALKCPARACELVSSFEGPVIC